MTEQNPINNAEFMYKEFSRKKFLLKVKLNDRTSLRIKNRLFKNNNKTKSQFYLTECL